MQMKSIMKASHLVVSQLSLMSGTVLVCIISCCSSTGADVFICAVWNSSWSMGWPKPTNHESMQPIGRCINSPNTMCIMHFGRDSVTANLHLKVYKIDTYIGCALAHMVDENQMLQA